MAKIWGELKFWLLCVLCETQSCWHDIFWVMFLSNYKMAVTINALPTWQVVVGMKWENSCANTLKSLKHNTSFITVFCSLADSLCPISFVKFYKTPCVLLETSDHLSYLSEMCQRGHLCWWRAIILLQEISSLSPAFLSFTYLLWVRFVCFTLKRSPGLCQSL